jgi:hypothetical protein
MAGYTRQSAASIVALAEITAAPLNAEFNQLQSAFSGITGHTHSGGAGDGPKIPLSTSMSGQLPIANGGTAGTTAATARDNLGLEIGVDIQAWDPDLQGITNTLFAADTMPYSQGSSVWAATSLTSFSRTLLDDTTAAAWRTTLGVDASGVNQPLDADLTALAANATDGFWAHTGAGTGSARTLTAPAAGFTITNPAGIAGNPTFVLANDLAALEAMSSNGIVTRTTSETYALRTITGTANEITLTNGDGVSGNPTISIPSAVTFTGKTITGGTYTGAALNGTLGATTPSTAVVTTISSSSTADFNSLIGAGRPPTVQTFTADGTWTKPAGCIRIIIEGVGGGGGSGGVDGQGTDTAGATAGGGSGAYGLTTVLNVSAISSASVTIGDGGAATAAGNVDGNNGGSTAITIGATTYTWGGGGGSPGYTGNTSQAGVSQGGFGGGGTNVTTGSWTGSMGLAHAGGSGSYGSQSGEGGSCPLGRGGFSEHSIAVFASSGNVGLGFGSGASGALSQGATTNASGGAGRPGFMRIWEYY